MINYIRKNKKIIIFCALISIFFIYPYISNNLNLEHDTTFHLSRIEGYATALKNFDFIPNIYPYKNEGFGYGSPMFYSDFLLLIPAILYNFNLSIALCYKLTILISSFFSALFMANLISHLTKNKYSPYLGAVLYLFSNYRICNTYIRGALGEIMAFIFIPIVLLGIYEVLLKDKNKYYLLIIGFSGLILTHNISFILMCIIFLFFIIYYYKNILADKNIFINIFKAAFITLLITSFFTIPMLEQIFSQKMYLHQYGTSSNLAASAFLPWQFTVNETIFGFASNTLDKSQTMTMNTGFLILLLPLFYLFDINHKSNKFIKPCFIFGYLSLFICSSIIPWEYLSLLSIIQFPFRLMIVSSTLLCIVASIAIFEVIEKKQLFIFILLFIISSVNSVYMLQPVLSRTLVINNDSKYSNLLDNSILDPYYNSCFLRVELAAADYLPSTFLDYKNASKIITDIDNNEIHDNFEKTYNTLIFSAPENTDIIIPITYYKGYQVYAINEDQKVKLETKPYLGRITINTNSYTEFEVIYKKTTIQIASIFVSITTLIYLSYYLLKKRKKIL